MDSIPFRVNKIYESGDTYLEEVLGCVLAAKKTIYVESYIFEIPDPGQRLLWALEEKKRQGLSVKVLVDGVGSLRHIRDLQDWSERSWVPVQVFHPLPWHRRWRILFLPFFILNLIWHLRTLNRRNHRKMVIIDGRIAFLGSINFAKVHFKEFVKNPWSDLSVQVEGHLVQDLDQAFLEEFERPKLKSQKAWSELAGALKKRLKLFPLEHRLRLNKHFLWRYLFWRDFLWRIRHAKSRVYIMNAYFVPHRTLLRSLSVAARRGVDVVVMLPSQSDVPVVKWFAPLFYYRLLKAGVKIREMKSEMIHTKAAIIDDWALIGSNNLNYRSLIHDLEVEAVINEPPWIEVLLKIWDQKLGASRDISLDEATRLSIFAKIRCRLVLLIRYFV